MARLGILALLFIALLAGLLLWLNGPGYRWLAHKYGPDFLAQKGFAADFELAGTLWDGPLVKHLELHCATTPLKHLRVENLKLSYDPWQLKDLRIEGLTADVLRVDLDLSQTVEKEEAEPEPESGESATLAETLAKYRPLALAPELRIGQLDVHVHRGEQNFYQLEGAQLSHPAGSEVFQLEPGQLTDFENEKAQPAMAEIEWLPDRLSLRSVPLARQLTLEDIELVPEPLTLTGRITAYDSLFTIDTDLRSRVTLALEDEPLGLGPFFALVPATEGVDSWLSELRVNAQHLDQGFSAWTIDLKATLEDTVVDQRIIPTTSLALLKEHRELDTRFRFALPAGQKLTEQFLDIRTVFSGDSADNPATFWQNSRSDVTTELPSIASFLAGLAIPLRLPEPPDGWPEGEALLLATANLENGEPSASRISLTFNELSWAEATLRRGELTLAFTDLESALQADLFIEQSENSLLTSTASYHPEEQSYAAKFSADGFRAETLQPFIGLSLGEAPLSGRISMDWEGQGVLPDSSSHQGSLSFHQTEITLQDREPIQLALAASYEGMETVRLPKLEVQQGDQRAATEAYWDGKRLEIPRLELFKAGQQLVTGTVSVPLALDMDFKNYLQLDESWNVELQAESLDVAETAGLFALTLPKGLQAQLDLDVSVAGSPAEPTLAGKVQIAGLSLAEIEEVPVTGARLAWATAGQTLTLDGTIEPEGRNAIVINGSTGFFPKKWAENPESFLEESFTLRANAPQVELAPFAELSPKVKLLDGRLALQVQADGTYREPNLTGSLKLDLPQARFDIERFRRVRETRAEILFADDVVTIQPFTTSTDGGVFTLTGTIDLEDTSDPGFNLRLLADKALVWRDDNINSRADGDVRLTGTLQQARISGELGVVESLFYKDVELLPLNVPVSMPKAPKLPSLAAPRKKSGGKKDALPIPLPYGNWELALRARTADPFLVRGNLTKGQVTGALTATGTLANPALNGTLVIENFEAALPFSTLTINDGQAIFSPANGFIPALDIRAQSRIPPHNVDLFISGKATSPELSFASNPPLPESEIITLLATGTTTSGLEDTDAARGKAFQLLIEQIRRAPPGSPLHPLAKFADPLKDVEIQVAGADPFTGKRRNSVTIPVPESDRWFVTAAVDSESNTRGLVLYILRFN
ncbi:translocation/assembly module TamB domain-containing protein [Roseibacillus ishigakijimensis]|uniref:Translocation/assembly module TamB domain-containing protein n=1 Tax=Roseibacillus ishigakijimensis TaxID=454146 RepID=A0A934RW44_9BACT|nr:translocation/assembly module TamB domain-containing protein [Roseibacillus ishigakijimensis]